MTITDFHGPGSSNGMDQMRLLDSWRLLSHCQQGGIIDQISQIRSRKVASEFMRCQVIPIDTWQMTIGTTSMDLQNVASSLMSRVRNMNLSIKSPQNGRVQNIYNGKGKCEKREKQTTTTANVGTYRLDWLRQ